MDTKQLKAAIARDLNTLAALEVEIMPAKKYYWANFKGFVFVYGSLVVAGLLASYLALFSHVWDSDFNRHPNFYYEMLVKMVAGNIFAPLFFMLFIYGKIKNYVLFKYQISSQLKTGTFIIKKTHQAAILGLMLYSFAIFPSIMLMEPDVTFFAHVGTFLFSAIVLSILVDMEVSRIGLSVLTQAVTNYFNKTRQGDMMPDDSDD